MAPRASLEMLPSTRGSFAVSQVKREWLVLHSVVPSHAKAIANKSTNVIKTIVEKKNVSPERPKQEHPFYPSVKVGVYSSENQNTEK